VFTEELLWSRPGVKLFQTAWPPKPKLRCAAEQRDLDVLNNDQRKTTQMYKAVFTLLGLQPNGAYWHISHSSTVTHQTTLLSSVFCQKFASVVCAWLVTSTHTIVGALISPPICLLAGNFTSYAWIFVKFEKKRVDFRLFGRLLPYKIWFRFDDAYNLANILFFIIFIRH